MIISISIDLPGLTLAFIQWYLLLSLFFFKAGNVTASLKELFHVIYLKHKHEREKADQAKNPDGANAGSQQDNEIETGVEETEQKQEDPYAVSVYFQNLVPTRS